jgi:hypothetical protein
MKFVVMHSVEHIQFVRFYCHVDILLSHVAVLVLMPCGGVVVPWLLLVMQSLGIKPV